MLVENKIFLEDIDYIANICGGELTGKRVLVTGACGMIGTMLSYSLMKVGATVYGLDICKERAAERFAQFMGNKTFIFINADITKPLRIGYTVDYIIHAASNAYPKAFDVSPVETMLQNFMGVKYLLDYAVKQKARLLYVSTGEVYGEGNGCDFDETYSGYVDITNPRACYPSSKRAAETLCVSYKKEYGADIVIARPSHVYGLTATKADTRAATQFIKSGVSGNDIVMKSAGNQVRSYTYIADCVAAMLQILMYGKCGEAYNIAVKNSIVSIRKMAEIIADICGVNVVFDAADSSEKASYNPASRSVLTSEKLYNLGFKGKYDIRTGIERTIAAL